MNVRCSLDKVIKRDTSRIISRAAIVLVADMKLMAKLLESGLVLRYKGCWQEKVLELKMQAVGIMAVSIKVAGIEAVGIKAKARQ